MPIQFEINRDYNLFKKMKLIYIEYSIMGIDEKHFQHFLQQKFIISFTIISDFLNNYKNIFNNSYSKLHTIEKF